MTTGRKAGCAALFGALLLTGCSGSGASVSISPAGGSEGTRCAVEGGATVCVTPGTAQGSVSSGSTPSGGTAVTGTGSAPPARWGGGKRVGVYPTRGTVSGLLGSDRVSRTVTGTCDIANDVRTITSQVDATSTLVIDVTTDAVASISLKIKNGPTRAADYLGEDVVKVITLTRTRTLVRGAVLLPVNPGGGVEPATLDADFDC
jgi:hypothetical protein